MTLSDNALHRLQQMLEEPDLTGTKYTLIRRIGRGGMASVFVARDSELNREVAVKVLTIPDSSGEITRRMLAEARVVASLEHPGIIPIHDAGELSDGRVFYVMKYVRGKSLDQHAKEIALTERLRLFQKICDAIAFAHSKGVLHRDLKPQNIMVGPFGEVLVMDWGLAKTSAIELREQVPTLQNQINAADTQHGQILGTPDYMAPEQATGDPNSINEQTDIYGLGGILHFLIFASPPEESQLYKDVPKPLAAICRKALSKAQNNRYSSAAELSKEIGLFLDGMPVEAYRESLFERLRRWMSRNYFVVILVLTYLFMRAILLLFGRH